MAKQIEIFLILTDRVKLKIMELSKSKGISFQSISPEHNMGLDKVIK